MRKDNLENRLLRHIEALTRSGSRHRTNPAGVTAALSYITETLESYGYQVVRVEYGAQPQNVNLIADIQAPTGQAPLVELGAHWDSVAGSPGADDNASGVAGLLEIAHELVGDASQRGVRFCFFGDEEDSDQFPQGRGGSREHVRQLGEGTIDVEGAIVLEMIGYTDYRPGSQQFPSSSTDGEQDLDEDLPGIFIAAVGNNTSRDYIDALVTAAETLEPTLPVVPVVAADGDGDLARSDHSSYWDAGRKGVMLTDTANFRNPNYHTSADTVETLDLVFAAKVTRTVIGAVRQLAS